MKGPPFQRIGSLKTVDAFADYCRGAGIHIPCDTSLVSGADSPLAKPITRGPVTLSNRFAIHPMEGWDGTADGKPTELTERRWRNFGRSGAKLIWGGEAVAVRHEGRANPWQLLLTDANRPAIGALREALIEEHRNLYGRADDLLIGLQLTHSGRYSRPNGKPEPKIPQHHPILDRRFNLPADHPLMSDDDLRRLSDEFITAAKWAHELGYQFVDIKHCHGYLLHELLGAHTRPGPYGGSLENRTRFLRDVTGGIKANTPGLMIGVRLSAFDLVPYHPDPATSKPGKLGMGVPEDITGAMPYRFGFGVDVSDPTRYDLTEPREFLRLIEQWGIVLVNLSGGSPYYNPHIQRPAAYPPSDGYQPPEDPLVGVLRQMEVARELKRDFPHLLLVGTGYTYLQDYLPHVAQAAVREGWVDVVGLGRMVLSYAELPGDLIAGKPLANKRICRTFSDCTTAPRNGMVSGCYPLDDHYTGRPEAIELRKLKKPKKV